MSARLVLGTLGAMGALGSSVPVTPDPSQAAQWATRELARPEYHQSTSLWTMFVEWINKILDSLTNGSVPMRNMSVAVVAVAVVIAAIVLWRVGPLARRRRVDAPAPAFEADDARTAAQMEAAARAAAQAGRWSEALLEYFRALARGLEERAILDDRPGRTAREVVAEACVVFPDAAARLAQAGTDFEVVYYGSVAATQRQCAQMAALTTDVRALRPVRTAQEVGV